MNRQKILITKIARAVFLIEKQITKLIVGV